MTALTTPTSTISNTNKSEFWQGCLAILPLSIAVIPWGILAGSLAIDAGLSPLESQAMSAIVFAGAAQLVALGMIKTGAGLLSILMTTLLITSRHFLYSMALRTSVSELSRAWRVLLGFLLTDELFAIMSHGKTQCHHLSRWYALGGGVSFYLCWNLSSLVGIVAGQTVDNIEQLGLDFAIVATFIALIVPMIKRKSVLVCIGISLASALLCELFKLSVGLLISALLGMIAGHVFTKISGEYQ